MLLYAVLPDEWQTKHRSIFDGKVIVEVGKLSTFHVCGTDQLMTEMSPVAEAS